jgi:hypothetical protein
MNLPLPATVLLLFSPSSAARLLSSLPNSVCDHEISICNHKKTSLAGWLPLPQAHHLSPSPVFFFPHPLFPLTLAPFSLLFELQVASNPA